ncbi:MAG: hypothetical protein ACK2UI_06420, partial [Anaerolineae bacterium]
MPAAARHQRYRLSVLCSEQWHSGIPEWHPPTGLENKRIIVTSDKLDRLMNLVSDLVTSNAMLTMASKTKDLDLLENVAEKFERLTRQFRDNALSIRLVSIRELL